MATRAQRAQLQGAFLSAFAQFGNVMRACRESGADRRTVYKWKAGDPAFADAFADAEIESVEHLENEAYRRAVEGTDKPVYQGGALVGTIREYSDTLLTLLLKARAPHKYRERASVEHSGPDGGPIPYRPDLSRLSDEELDALARLSGKLHPQP
jgi:hypothetical protein